MMNKESKVKTFKELGERYNLNLGQAYEKWVPLEEAQKEIDNAKDAQFIQDGKAAAIKINALNAKIAEANKILDECDQLSGWGSVENQLMRLRVVLK
jgi:hypothetical protein